MKVGIVYICMGRYWEFFSGFYESATKFLFPTHEKHFYVFTDHEENIPRHENVTVIPKESMSWDECIFSRYEMVLSQKEVLAENDYLLMCNANLRIEQPVLAGNTLPVMGTNQRFSVVRHLQFGEAFTNTKMRAIQELNTEQNPNSKAYILPEDKPYPYVFGGFVAAKPQDFFSLAETMVEWRAADKENGINPIWHDESYLNKYLTLDKTRFRILPQGYLLPELEKEVIVRRFITIIEKSTFFGTDNFK